MKGLGTVRIAGRAVPIEAILVSAALGALLAWIACANMRLEGMHSGLVGAPIAYNMRKGVPALRPDMEGPPGAYNTWYSPLDGNTQGLPVPLPKGRLAIFAENRNSPSCCQSSYSASDGCVCATPEQMKYINMRGGNRTLTSIF